ncbi:MAG: aldehyde dehydrogenase family protein [Pseudomonadales bacterium]
MSKNGLSTETLAFLQGPRSLLINGEAVTGSGETVSIVDPSSGEVICDFPLASAADIDAAVTAARSALTRPSWSGMSGYERATCLYRLADLIEAHAETLAEIESLDFGMPIRMSRAMMASVPSKHLRYCAGWATRLDGTTKSSFPDTQTGGIHGFTFREPVGVVGAIIPWNSPMVMAIIKLAPALACGCTIVLKPSELTPLTAQYLGELAAAAGFPPGVINIVPGLGYEAGQALVDHPLLAKIAFTGSSNAARAIVGSVAEKLTPVALELGGKAPAIICADANLDAAARVAAGSCTSLQGQSCAAITRIYVERAVYPQFLERLTANLQALKIGPALDESSSLGPLVSASQYQRVQSYIAAGISAGATALSVSSTLPEGDGFYIAPVIFTDTKPSMSIVSDEIFGPVVVVEPFDSLDEAIALANDSPYGLFASAWTASIDKAHFLMRVLDVGYVAINGSGAFDASMPFGGVKQSGWGREFGEESVTHYTRIKTVAVTYDVS